MEVDSKHDAKTAASTTGQVVDWFANVARSDLKTAPRRSVERSSAASDETGTLAISRGDSIRRLVARYQRLPSWVLLLQVFLAFAWGRSALAHALASDWWNGQQVLRFLATETGLRVDAYQWVLLRIVEPIPAPVALLVVAVELVIAVLLLLNYRVPIALGFAVFLNVQLILAGQVSPSVFFLVAALGIAIWRFETTAGQATLQRLSEASVLAGIVVVAFLGPAVRTLAPKGVLEDPAFVLIFVSALTVLALWWVNRRVTVANKTLAALTGDDMLDTAEPWTLPSIGWVVGSLAAAGVILLAGFTVLRTDQTLLDEAAVAAPADDLAQGSFDSPYPLGLNVTLSYNDLSAGESRSWRVQVLEAVLGDRSAPIQIGPTDEGRLAMARVRLTYHQGIQAGQTQDIRFNAIGPTGSVYPAKIEGCGTPNDRLSRGELAVGRAVEGWICWPVPDDEAASLMLAVEAIPADGVLYMELQDVVED